MLHMSQTDAKMVSKIHCMLKKVAAPPGVWAKCLVRACMSPYHPRSATHDQHRLLQWFGPAQGMVW